MGELTRSCSSSATCSPMWKANQSWYCWRAASDLCASFAHFGLARDWMCFQNCFFVIGTFDYAPRRLKLIATTGKTNGINRKMARECSSAFIVMWKNIRILIATRMKIASCGVLLSSMSVKTLDRWCAWFQVWLYSKSQERTGMNFVLRYQHQ